MDPTIVAAVIGGAVALVVAVIQLARPAGDYSRFKRWLEIKEHIRTQAERDVVDERLRHYLVRFTVSDRTRGRVLMWVAIGIGLIGFALLTLQWMPPVPNEIFEQSYFERSIGIWVWVVSKGWGVVLLTILGSVTWLSGITIVISMPLEIRGRERESVLAELNPEYKEIRESILRGLDSKSTESPQ